MLLNQVHDLAVGVSDEKHCTGEYFLVLVRALHLV
jgi:hypothetical protein